jgi:hypothetical protein
MRFAGLLLMLACLGSAACATEPTMAGTWAWEYNGNPGGSNTTLFLQEDGGKLSGTGVLLGVGPLAVPDTMTITGSRFGSLFALHLSQQGAADIAYAGQLVRSDQLRGTWTQGAASTEATVIFNRQ